MMWQKSSTSLTHSASSVGQTRKGTGINWNACVSTYSKVDGPAGGGNSGNAYVPPASPY